jgi:hypothetical protein
MSSIVPGFEYDIFISYRHNDNRSDWVTDFVNALQEEFYKSDPYFKKLKKDSRYKILLKKLNLPSD